MRKGGNGNSKDLIEENYYVKFMTTRQCFSFHFILRRTIVNEHSSYLRMQFYIEFASCVYISRIIFSKVRITRLDIVSS